MSKVSVKILRRVYLLFGMVALFSVVIIARVVQIQFVQKDKWTSEVQKDRVYEQTVQAARGNILADNGEVLATSQPFYRLPIDPSRLDPAEEGFGAKLDSLCKLLAGRFGTVQRDRAWFHDRIAEAIRTGDQHLYLVRDKVDFEDYRAIRNWPLLRRSKYKGGLIPDKLNNKRFYPHDSLGRIALGVMMYDTIPLKGIEFAFHKYLKGVEGISLVRRISNGDEMPLEVFREDEDGADVVTTLNVDMQEITESALRKAVLDNKARSGVAILMEVATGEIKAMANYPEVQNHAVATRIEPGSTFKLATFMAALKDGRILLDDTIDTGDGVQMFYDKAMRDHLALGKITWREAFEQSSNVATALLAMKNYGDDLDRWFAHLDRFGLTERVMVQEHIVGEPDPIIVRPGHEEWAGTTLPWMAIGYNSQLTPLQILTYYNAVANNGKMVEPILVRRVRKGSRVVHEFRPKVLREKIASDKVLGQVRELLEGVVENGTARGLRIPECRLAGKTGTAKKYIDSLGSYSRVYQASFCGYFPAEDPRYSCYVMIDEPRGDEYYGATVAGPVFREIAQQVSTADLEMIPRFRPEEGRQVPRPVTQMVWQTNAEAVYRKLDINAAAQAEALYVRTRDGGDRIEFSRVELAPGRVPSVRGMSAKDAVALLEGLGLKVRLQGHGKVQTQSVAPGARIEPQTTITLELS